MGARDIPKLRCGGAVLGLFGLGVSFLGAADGAQGVDGGDAADGTGGEAGLQHFAVGTEGEIGRVNDAAPLFPVGADAVCVLGHFEAVADRKGRAGSLKHLLGFIERINR